MEGGEQKRTEGDVVTEMLVSQHWELQKIRHYTEF